MKRDTASYEELQQDHARHWKQVGSVRDARYGVVRAMLGKPWRCPQCGTSQPSGGVCTTCREARVIDVE